MLHLKWIGLGVLTWFLVGIVITLLFLPTSSAPSGIAAVVALAVGILGYRGEKAKRRERAAASAKPDDSTQRSVTF